MALEESLGVYMRGLSSLLLDFAGCCSQPNQSSRSPVLSDHNADDALYDWKGSGGCRGLSFPQLIR
jgi:hypothetical protein